MDNLLVEGVADLDAALLKIGLGADKSSPVETVPIYMALKLIAEGRAILGLILCAMHEEDGD